MGRKERGKIGEGNIEWERDGRGEQRGGTEGESEGK